MSRSDDDYIDHRYGLLNAAGECECGWCRAGRDPGWRHEFDQAVARGDLVGARRMLETAEEGREGEE